jgi:hypothetical protein
VLCAEPAVRRHLAFVSLSPRTFSREPCRPPPPSSSSTCLSASASPAVGRPEGGEHRSHVHTVALFCGPGRGAVRLHAKPAHTRQELCCCFPSSCYSHPSACSSRAGAPSTTVALCWYLAAEIPCSQRLPSTRRPGGLNDARCLLLHRSRRGAGHVTPLSPRTWQYSRACRGASSSRGENPQSMVSRALISLCHEIRLVLAPARGTRTHTRTTRRIVNTRLRAVNGRPTLARVEILRCCFSAGVAEGA